jgi:HEXXH motif-containing protein
VAQLDAKLVAFSGPHVDGPARLFDEYVDALVMALCQTALTVANDAAWCDRAFREALERGITARRPGVRGWTPALGRAAQLLLGDSPAQRRAGAVQVALVLLDLFRDDAWTCRLEEQAALLFGAGSVALCGEVAVRPLGDAVAISTAGSAGVRWRDRRGLLLPEDHPGLPHVRVGDRSIPVYTGAAPEHALRLPPDESPSRRDANELAAQLQAALDLLERTSTRYYTWSTRLLSCLFGVAPHADMTTNGSSSCQPGLVYVTHPSNPAAFAPILVHECTHQYFYLAETRAPVVNGRDGRLYYSPLKHTDRPLDRILIGYHADGNILAYVEEALRAGTAHERLFRAEREQLRADLALLEQPLHRTEGLRPLGESLWRPLYDELLRIDRAAQPPRVREAS